MLKETRLLSPMLAEAQRMRALEPSGGTLTLLGITSYIGNMAQLPHSP